MAKFDPVKAIFSLADTNKDGRYEITIEKV
jgi:hypothetical protein